LQCAKSPGAFRRESARAAAAAEILSETCVFRSRDIRLLEENIAMGSFSLSKSLLPSCVAAALAGSLPAAEPSPYLPRMFPRMVSVAQAPSGAAANPPIPDPPAPPADTPVPDTETPAPPRPTLPAPPNCPCNPNGVPWAMYGTPGGYEGRIGSPYHYYNAYCGLYVMTGNPYYDHFGPGYHRHSLYGHYRFPYYSYRAPWYYPGRAVYNRDVNFAW
jgi:hypothetical protein